MKKPRNEFIKNLRYLCLIGIIAMGLATIVGSNGGGGGDTAATTSDGTGGDGDNGGGDGIGGGDLSWSCDAPSAPSSLQSQYRHTRYNIAAPAGNIYAGVANTASYQKGYLRDNLAVSENGSRVALALSLANSANEYNISQQDSMLYVFSPAENTPLWSYSYTETNSSITYPVFERLSMTRDGRGIVLFQRTSFFGKMLYFECDQQTPKWTWDSSTDSFAYGSDYHNWSMSSMAFSSEGDDILLVANDTDYYDPRQHVLQFRRDTNVPIRRLEFTSRSPIKAAISGDGSRIAVITREENPDDLDGDGYSVDTSLDYVHSRVMLYENGTLNWSTWLRHECTDCVITTYPWSVEVAISSDGSTVVASGPGGKVVSYDASTGAENWSYTVTDQNWSGDTIPDIIENLRVSDNGKKLVVSSAEYGVIYFDADGSSGELQWRMKDKMLPYVDLLQDDNPEPNGFELLHEEDFVGLDEDELISLALGLWPNVSMSNDGNVLLMTGAIDTNQYDQGYGHIYALYYGSPLPFQIISEDETNHDSDFIVNAISGNGAYMAAIAWDTDESEGNSEAVPRISLHTFEIPPGLIVDVTTSATLTITSNDVIMDALDEFVGSGDITVERHLVKPGRGATLVEDHTLVDQLGLMTVEQCISINPLDWFKDDNDREFSWGDGFQSDASVEGWDTPTCLTSVATTLSSMVLKSELLLDSKSGTLLDQEFDDYLNISLVVVTPP